VALVGEQVLQALGLGVGEQSGTGVQRAPDPVGRIALTSGFHC